MPDKFLTLFEYSRLNFSKFGTLRDLGETHSKLLLGGFVVVRIVLVRVMISYVQTNRLNDIQQKYFRAYLRNMTLIMSMIYRAYMKNLTSDMPKGSNTLEMHLSKVNPSRRTFPTTGAIHSSNSMLSKETI